MTSEHPPHVLGAAGFFAGTPFTTTPLGITTGGMTVDAATTRTRCSSGLNTIGRLIISSKE